MRSGQSDEARQGVTMYKTILLTVFLFFSSNLLAKPTVPLQFCQKAYDNMETMERYKRLGGTAQSMRKYRKAYKENREYYRKHNCKQYGNKINK